MDDKNYLFYEKGAEYIKSKVGDSPAIGIVLGTSLGDMESQIADKIEIPYGDIPGFLVSTAPGHAGKLICGMIGGKKVLCMSGRFHSYEGYDVQALRIPVYIFKLVGIKTLILTNAAGAINLEYEVGDICAIEDHINLCGVSPQSGPNIETFGKRFFSMNDAYTPALRCLAKECAQRIGFSLREGVYFFAPGPQFETPAEIRAMRLLGGDMVGMSTVPEVISAAHCGIAVLCLSLATNLSSDRATDHDVTEDVENVTENIKERFGKLLTEIVSGIEE